MLEDCPPLELELLLPATGTCTGTAAVGDDLLSFEDMGEELEGGEEGGEVLSGLSLEEGRPLFFVPELSTNFSENQGLSPIKTHK
jgi:hypothetical protein